MSIKLGIGCHMCGLVFWQAGSYSRRGVFGRLVMGILCQFEKINGFQGRQRSQSSLHAQYYLREQRWLSLEMLTLSNGMSP